MFIQIFSGSKGSQSISWQNFDKFVQNVLDSGTWIRHICNKFVKSARVRHLDQAHLGQICVTPFFVCWKMYTLHERAQQIWRNFQFLSTSVTNFLPLSPPSVCKQEGWNFAYRLEPASGSQRVKLTPALPSLGQENPHISAHRQKYTNLVITFLPLI